MRSVQSPTHSAPPQYDEMPNERSTTREIELGTGCLGAKYQNTGQTGGVSGEAHTTTTSNRVHGFRGDIEGIRGVAVTVVILYHLFPKTFAGGFIGVDVFFVISGFVIACMLDGWFASNSTASVRQLITKFYAFRFRRLLPASAAALVAIVLSAPLFVDYLAARTTITEAVHAALFHANYHFYNEAVDYAAQGGAVSAVLHFWSLAVEEQFYFLFPLLAWSIRSKPLGERCGIMVTTCAASFLYAEFLLYKGEAVLAFYCIAARWWEMAVGYIVATGYNVRDKRSKVASASLSYAGSGCVLVSLMALSVDKHFPGAGALLPVAGAGALLLAGEDAPANRLMSESSTLRWLGSRSYSLYLCHWPVIVLGSFENPDLGRLLQAVLLILTFAWAGERWIERPFRKIADVRAGLAVGAVATALCLAACVTRLATLRQPEFGGAIVDMQLNGRSADAFATHQRVINTSITTMEIPTNLLPPLSNTRLNYSASNELRLCNGAECTFQPFDAAAAAVSSNKTMILVGDSHAMHWFKSVRYVAHQLGITLRTRVLSACPFTTDRAIREISETRQVEREKCFAHNRAAIDLSTKADIVVISRLARTKPAVNATIHTQLHRERAQASGQRVVTWYIGDPPTGVSPSTLLNQGKQMILQPRQYVKAADAELSKLNDEPGIWYMPTTALFCLLGADGQEQCPAIIGKYFPYVDGEHLTGPFDDYMGPVIVSYLKKEMPKLWAEMCAAAGNHGSGCGGNDV